MKERPTLEYERPDTARETPRFGENVCLFGAFGLYALVNFALVVLSQPGVLSPISVSVAFAVPLPLAFMALVGLGRFLASPPLFTGRALLAFFVLLLTMAALNFYVAGDVAARV